MVREGLYLLLTAALPGPGAPDAVHPRRPGIAQRCARCINSVSLRFAPCAKMETEGYGHLLYLFEK